MNASPLDILANQLGNTAFEFLEAASEVWPDCPALKARLQQAKSISAIEGGAQRFSIELGKALQSHSALFERALNKDVELFMEPIAIFQELSIYEKISSAHPDVQATCWQYIEKIIQSANLNAVYTSAPADIMTKVTEVAENITRQIESGTFDPSTLNPAELTQQMMAGLDPNSIAQWAQVAMNPTSIGSLMGVMKSVMAKGGAPPMDLASLMGGGSAEDMETVKEMMGSMLQNLGKRS
jgi:hypothetical protein